MFSESPWLVFFDVLEVHEPPGNDSEWIWDKSLSWHFLSFLSFFECRMSGAKILAPRPFWVAAPWFRYVKGHSNRSEGVRKVFGFKNLIFHFRAINGRSKVRLTQNTLPSSMFGNMFSGSLLNVFWCPEGPGTSWEWFWMILGSIIFTSFFLIFVIFWVSNVGCQNACCAAVLGCPTLI